MEYLVNRGVLTLMVLGFGGACLLVPLSVNSAALEKYVYCVEVNNGQINKKQVRRDRLVSLAESARSEVSGDRGAALEAECWEAAGEYRKAVSALRRLKKAAQGNPQVDVQLGIVYYRMGAYEDSIEHLEKALSNSDGDVEARYYLAKSYYESSMFGEARAVLAPIITERNDYKIDSENMWISSMMDVEIYDLYARILWNLGDRSSAVESLVALVERNGSQNACEMTLELLRIWGEDEAVDKVRSVCG